MVLIKNYFALIFISLSVLTLLTFIIWKELIPSINDRHRKSWGIVFFPLSMFMLLLIYPNDRQILVLSFLILGFSDALAAIAGTKFSKSYFTLISDKKSWIGSSVFFIVTVAIVYIAASGDYFSALGGVSLVHYSSIEILLIALISGIILTPLEMLGAKGSDNILVPIFASFILYTFGIYHNNALIYDIFTGILLGGIAGFVSYKLKFLTKDGAVAAFLLAAFVYGYGGWKWTVPILTFFILSSLISKARKKKNRKVDDYFDKTGTRDYLQVLANGGIAGALVLVYYIYKAEVIYLAYLVFVAAACADTWSTEIGNIFRGKTVSIITFKPVHPGVSGGVSVQGFIGGLAGAAAVVFSAFAWIDIHHIFALIIIGFLGTVTDSIIGATLQQHYRCEKCGIITERKHHCDAPTSKYFGLRYIDNDAVNLLSCTISAFIIYVFL
ncbi:MAG: DUF92 domain-containing protein [Ignavibacteriaceae bacterium]